MAQSVRYFFLFYCRLVDLNVYICSMKGKATFIYILLAMFTLPSMAQTIEAMVVGELEPGLGNTSSLIYWNDCLWTSNDHGTLTLHCIDTLSGRTQQQLGCDTTFNDMEEVAQDADFVYFGDFGNNHARLRDDLRILRMSKADLLQGVCRFDTIAFTYAGYDPDGAGADGVPTTDFDCEAMVAMGDSLLLFTKQWTTQQTTCFALPKEPGAYTAQPHANIDVEGLVTGACLTAVGSPEGTRQVLALCGYSLFVKPFVYLIYGFDGMDLSHGQHLKLLLKNPIGTQTEAIATADGMHYWLTNEAFERMGISRPAQLLSLDLTEQLIGYLYPDSTHTYDIAPVDGATEGIVVHPNPTDGTLNVDLPNVERIELVDTTGRLLLHSESSSTLDLGDLNSGTYLLRITTREGKTVSCKVVKH